MSGLKVRCEERIRRTPEEVWKYVVEAYFAHHANWDPAILGMEQTTSGPVGKGTRGLETRRFVTRQSAEFEVTEFEKPGRFALHNTTGPFAIDRSYSITPDTDGVLLAFEFDMAPKGVMRLPFPLLKGTIERQVRANIARIPALVEASSGQAG